MASKSMFNHNYSKSFLISNYLLLINIPYELSKNAFFLFNSKNISKILKQGDAVIQLK